MDIFDGPSVFQKNTEIYKEFLDETIQHTRGFFILAPSGSGKTHFIKRQLEKNWIDGDKLWETTRAHPDAPWWTMSRDIIREVDARSDVVTQEAKRLGMWIMGASNNWLSPDAIVLLPWETNVAYIKKREVENYDGGLKSHQLEQLELHHKDIKEMAKSRNIPVFDSVEKAVNHLQDLYKN